MEAGRAWAQQLHRDQPEVVRVGYFGSYARGDYVPGSDFDVLIELSNGFSAADARRRADRSARYRPDKFPVAMEVHTYTTQELAGMRAAGTSFLQTIDAEIRWLT